MFSLSQLGYEMAGGSSCEPDVGILDTSLLFTWTRNQTQIGNILHKYHQKWFRFKIFSFLSDIFETNTLKKILIPKSSTLDVLCYPIKSLLYVM